MKILRYMTKTGSAAGLFLLLLLAADAAFLGVHLINEFSPAVNNRLYALHVDRSYSEVFQYVKFIWVGLLLALVGLRLRAPVYAGWVLLFAYLVCDDALRIHERAGAFIVDAHGVEGAFGLRGQDIGELTVSGGAGLLLFGLIAALYPRSDSNSKNASQDLVALMAVLVFFGVFFDLLHVVLAGPVAGALFNVLEDGGEMVAVSLMGAYAFRLHLAGGCVPASLLKSALPANAGVASLRPSS